MTDPIPARRRSLDQLQVRSPCHESWDAMSGDGGRRYCEQCAKHVHDLSHLSGDEVERLIAGAASAGTSVCVRMMHDGAGRLITRDTAPHVMTRMLTPRPASRAATAWPRVAASIATALGLGSLLSVLGCERRPSSVMGSPMPWPTTVPSGAVELGDVALPATRPANVTEIRGEVVAGEPGLSPSPDVEPIEQVEPVPAEPAPAPAPLQDAPVKMGKIAPGPVHPAARPERWV